MASGDEAGMEVLVCCIAVCIKFGVEGADQDGIAAVEGGHDVLIAAARLHRKMAHVICEELADGFVPNVKFFGGCMGDERRHRWCWGLWGFGLGGADAPADLCEMSFDGLVA